MEDSVTLLLARAQNGDRAAENQALRLVYDRLRAIARGVLRSERPGHTLQPTALVSEVFLQKLRRISTPLNDREHFYSLAAYAMRQVLIDHARRASASRRVPPEAVADMLMTASEAPAVSEERLAVQQALEALGHIDSGASSAIRCRFIEGLSLPETVERLRTPLWKVRADCEFGLNWMARRLGPSSRH